MTQSNKINTVFIIGAQRCGTTYLYSILEKHPQICLAKPIKPEPKFFLNPEEITKGKNYYLNTYFSSCDHSAMFFIEKSTSYIESIEAGKQMKKMFPRSKILILLRNPVERAISNYFFSANNGLEVRSPEDVFLYGKPIPQSIYKTSVSPFNYIERGEYIKYIKPYLEIFRKNNTGIFIFEEIQNNPDKMNEILNFIGIEGFSNPIPEEIFKPVNQSIRNSDINPEIKKELEKHYSGLNQELENLLGRRIEAWH